MASLMLHDDCELPALSKLHRLAHNRRWLRGIMLRDFARAVLTALLALSQHISWAAP